MGRRAASETPLEKGLNSDEQNGDTSEPRAPLTTAQRLAVATASTEVAPDPFGIDAKYFTEQRVLNRDVSIMLSFFFFQAPANTLFPIWTNSIWFYRSALSWKGLTNSAT